MSTKSLATLAAVLGARLFTRGELLIPLSLGQCVAPKTQIIGAQ